MIYKSKDSKQQCEAFRIGYDKVPQWFLDLVTRNDVKSFSTRMNDDIPISVTVITKTKTIEAERGEWVIDDGGDVYILDDDEFHEDFDLITQGAGR